MPQHRLRSWEGLSWSQRRVVLRAARRGESHPDPAIAKAGRDWARAVLVPSATSRGVRDVVLRLVEDPFGGLLGRLSAERRAARRILRVRPRREPAHPDDMTAVLSSDDIRNEVSRLWEEHLRASFPARLRDAEVAGVDVVMVDADVAGCVSTWVHGSGPLARGTLAVLEHRVRDLDGVLSVLRDQREIDYCGRLRELARLLLLVTS